MTNGISIQVAALDEAEVIHQLAHKIWWPTYGNLLPHDQIAFMLETIYSVIALQKQMETGQRFSLAKRNMEAVGFVGFQQKPGANQMMRIEKLYVLPSEQGKGTGKLLISHVSQIALAAHLRCLELNIYRHNPARAFYERQGFVIMKAVDIPFYEYMLTDYIMQKQLL